jgi:ABC-type sulfate/molybdate transport systems ATPase subunit
LPLEPEARPGAGRGTGEAVGLVGANGSGKTTLLRVLATLVAVPRKAWPKVA